MKKICLLFALCGLIAFTSCQKRGMHLFRGDYSFKTSGSVTLDEINPEGEPASYTVSLPKDFTKNTLLFTGDSITLKNEVRVQASGQMYEDKTIVINMIYDGEAETDERSFTIHGDNIRMAATRNN